MLKFYAALQKYYQYTDYQIKVVHYAIITLVSEFSKFFALGIFFFVIGKETEYLWTILNFFNFTTIQWGISLQNLYWLYGYEFSL